MGASRVVVVVPRHEAALHQYLRTSLGSLTDVEVVLDRREHRRTPSKNERTILMCSLVHCASPPPAPPDRPAAHVESTHRTLLWPALRLEDL